MNANAFIHYLMMLNKIGSVAISKVVDPPRNGRTSWVGSIPNPSLGELVIVLWVVLKFISDDTSDG